MNKEEINPSLRHELIKALNEQYQKGFVDGIDEVQRLENNTLTIEIPKEYTFIQIKKEYSIGDKYYVDLGLMAKSDVCGIRQPHPGFDCGKCNKVEDKPELPEEIPNDYSIGSGLEDIIDTKVKTINQIIRYLKAKEK